ncbi:MAG: histidine kinase [Acidobacteriota bacterium]|jgi:signal transduction histidine kinase|nr:MAG: hypothetical protein DIU54_03095 [Acidobacteriota bacterium]
MSRRLEIDLGRQESPSRFGAVSLRTALLVGFGLTVGVWLFAGLYFGSRIAELDRQTTEVSERYVHAQRLLMSARMGVLLSSVHLRDALLARDDEVSEQARARVTAELEQAAESLARYVPVVNAANEHARVERLLGEITALRAAMLEMLGTDHDEWPDMAASFLSGRLTPRREAFMAVADELGTLNRTTFVAHQNALVDVYRQTQLRIWQVFGLTLAASLGIAVLSMLYAARLERKVRAQHSRDVEMQHGLQRLSSELMRVREEERRTLARELHDEVGQLLTAVKFQLASAERTLEERGVGGALLDGVRPVVEQALQTVRDLSHLLHPQVLDDLGLTAAVDLHIREFRRRHNEIRVELTESGLDERLPREIETVAYRIVQEALTNVIKHSGAKSCRVSLIRMARSLMVVVGDDGKGFEQTQQPARRGLGLVSMRERVLQVGGVFVVESAPGQGTRLVAELPVPEREERLDDMMPATA